MHREAQDEAQEGIHSWVWSNGGSRRGRDIEPVTCWGAAGQGAQLLDEDLASSQREPSEGQSPHGTEIRATPSLRARQVPKDQLNVGSAVPVPKL